MALRNLATHAGHGSLPNIALGLVSAHEELLETSPEYTPKDPFADIAEFDRTRRVVSGAGGTLIDVANKIVSYGVPPSSKVHSYRMERKSKPENLRFSANCGTVIACSREWYGPLD
jgi:hypothetical protein